MSGWKSLKSDCPDEKRKWKQNLDFIIPLFDLAGNTFSEATTTVMKAINKKKEKLAPISAN